MRSKSGPGGTLCQYGLRELAQRQAVLLCKDKSTNRAIKSDRAKVVMTAGCISRIYKIFTHKKTFTQMDKGLISMVTQEGLEPPTL